MQVSPQAMKLYYGSASGFSRKARIVIDELGLTDRIELLLVKPQKDVELLSKVNPLGKIPALSTETTSLYDSAVICEYLIATADNTTLLPESGPERWDVLKRAALGDGILEAGMLGRAAKSSGQPDGASYEWQIAKVRRGLDEFEHTAPSRSIDIDLGDIALACAIGWLQFRLPDLDVLAGRPKIRAWYDAIVERRSLSSTMPFD